MSPRGFPPGPLERVYIPLVIAIVVGLGVQWEARRREKGHPWLRGVGFGLVTLVVAGVSLLLAVFFLLGVYLLVRR